MLASVASVHRELVMKLVAEYDGHGVNLVILQKFGVRAIPLGDIVFILLVTRSSIEPHYD